MTSTYPNTNEACCSIPPVSHDYTPKGEYKAYAGLDKCYFVGPTGTGKVIVIVYDIFGFFPQTLQGADILAETLQARVIMPDFLKGQPWPVDKFPPGSIADKAALQVYFGTTANPAFTLPYITAVGAELKKDGATKIGILGFCWGGKCAFKAGGEDWVDAVATVHPAMLSADDVDNIKVPVAMYLSQDEPIEEYQKLVDTLADRPFATKNSWKVYPSVNHGFAAARANLTDPDGKAQFEDVYSRLSSFFKRAFE